MQIDLSQELSPEVLAALKVKLESAGLRFTTQLPERIKFNENPTEGLINLLFVDTETTGSDEKVDKIIEYGGVLVNFDPKTGIVYNVLDIYGALEDPGMPISEEATKVNGITNEMVAGYKIDDAKVNDMVSKAQLIACHNSKFDRPFLENRFPCFIDKAFACTLHQIDWSSIGISSGKLEFILYKLGFHYEGHRAVNDVFALIEASQAISPETGSPVLLEMLEKARMKEFDLAALGSPFDSKDTLKARGYRWLDDGKSKYWHIAVKEADREAEIDWLRENVYSNKKFTLREEVVTFKTRFSQRNGVVKEISC